MEGFVFFIKGVVLGFSIAAPVGPIGVLCIRRTLSNGMVSGILSGLGTATADALYGCIAAFGLTVISAFLVDNQSHFRLIGGLFLLYLGYTTFRSNPPALDNAGGSGKGLLGDYVSSLFLTLTNPMTIISFAAIFAGLGVGQTSGNFALAGLLVFGVFIGSMLWWLILSRMVIIFRSRLDQKRLKWANQFSGIVIAAFGIVSLMMI